MSRPTERISDSGDGRCEADRLFRSVFERTAKAVGEDFFRELVRQLAETLRVPFAWVSECVGPPEAAPSRVRPSPFGSAETSEPTRSTRCQERRAKTSCGPASRSPARNLSRAGVPDAVFHRARVRDLRLATWCGPAFA